MRILKIVSLWMVWSLPAFAGLHVEGGRTQGPDGFRTQTVGASMSLPWIDSQWAESADPLSVNRLWGGVRQTRYLRNGADESRRREYSGGIEFFKRVSLEAGFWNLPNPVAAPTHYRARGWNGAATLKGAERAPELKLFGASTRHEQQVAVREWMIGGQLAQTFPSQTTLRFSGEHHSYKQDLHRLSASGEFVDLRQAAATGETEALEGFTKKAFGLGVEQKFGPWARLSTDWRRAYYVIGRSPHSNSLTTRFTLRLARIIYLGASYEVFKPSLAPTATYKGVSVTLSF